MNNKIIINGKVFTKKYISGVQRYTLEIINELDKIDFLPADILVINILKNKNNIKY